VSSKLALALALLVAGTVVSAPRALPAPRAASAGVDSIVLLHTNDTHARLVPFASGRAGLVGGAAARAATLARERALGGATLTLDAGDVFQGTPFFNFFRGVPDYRAMSRMGYDLGALGNHDLDDGPAAWLRTRREARFPIVCANVFVAAESSWARELPEAPERLARGARWIGGGRVVEGTALRHITEPYRVHEVGGRRVAILGLLTRETVRIVSARRNGGVAVADPVETARALVPRLREEADVVLVLSHLGVDEDRRLASRVPGIDVIVGGHSHTLLPEPIVVLNARTPNGLHGTAVVQAGSLGEWVGRTTLRFEGDALGRVTGRTIRVRPQDGEDAAIAAFLAPYRDSVAAATAIPVFQLPRRVGPEGLRDGDTALGNFFADALREAAGADIAIQNSGGIRAGLPAGAVTVGDVYTALPWDNTIVVVEMEGWRVRQLLDFIAGRIGGGGFAQVSGVRFTSTLGRATDIRVGREGLDGNRVYRVATSDYLFDGGDGYTQFARAPRSYDTGIVQREATVEFLRRHPDHEFRDDGRIRWEGGRPVPRELRRR
jgi:2',3'-cyclic-nucleotide 2'-phosphodiesterase (5'-nucleotidase family)